MFVAVVIILLVLWSWNYLRASLILAFLPYLWREATESLIYVVICLTSN